LKSFASGHYRWFDKTNPYWNNQDRRQNPIFVSRVQEHLNALLRARGYVPLNEALELLGFERTIVGGMNGWVQNPGPEEGDGYIYFGVWDRGMAYGKDWISGKLDVMTLTFNVDRSEISLPRRVKKLRMEGKI
jgi:hypothetical protein